MRLLYTLRYKPYSGNCGGDLRLFFTTRNSADWQPSPPPGLWLNPQNVGERLTLPSGDTIEFSLYPVTNGIPGQLFLFGAISAKTASGQTVAPSPIGQAGPPFVPNKPVIAILLGRDQQTQQGISWDVGFELAVPWDGTSADCTGQWWAIWYPSSSAPSAPTGLQGSTS